MNRRFPKEPRKEPCFTNRRFPKEPRKKTS
jgi:hypothetical protein